MVRPLLILLLGTLVSTATAEPLLESEPRRKEQWPDEPAHLFIPLPYSMPGIGSGYFFMGYLSNMLSSTADLAVIKATGDAKGLIAEADEIPLIKDRLHLQLFDMNISKATVNDYENRGMASDADAFNILEVSGVRQKSAQLGLNFFDRRLAFYYQYADSRSEVSAIRDNDGNLLTTFSKPLVSEGISRRFSAIIDLTDDYLDPRRGLRFSAHYADHPADSAEQSHYYTLDYSLLYHLPLNHVDTLVFNYYRSDAHMRTKGVTDPNLIAANDYGCGPLTATACDTSTQQNIDNTAIARNYGTATSLGGTDRMRSYGDGRFSGAHMAFFGIELRTNFVEDAVPFDYFIWKDVRTSIQLALFAEAGTVSETTGSLWDEQRYSYGVGARLLSASGSVYRADYAYGDEGGEFTVFFFYPWQ